MSKKYPLASQRKRYHNSFIDDYAFRLCLVAIILFVFLTKININDWVFWGVIIVFLVINELLLPYFTGRSIGMLITKTKIVQSNGKKPTFKQIFIRDLASYIPFEAITFITKQQPIGLHDSISK